jgi:hydrogenase maturation protease
MAQDSPDAQGLSIGQSRHGPPIIVLGIGTPTRGDDAFGPAVVHALRHHHPALVRRARLAYTDADPSRLLGLWENYRLALLIDATRGGAQHHGHLRRHDLSDVQAHSAVIGAAIRLGRVRGRLPDQLILYTVRGRDFHLGAPLSPPVARAVPELATRIASEILGVFAVSARVPSASPAGR